MFIEAAYTGKNQFWRYIVTIIIVLIATEFIGAIPLMVILIRYMFRSGQFELPENPSDFAAMGIDPNLGLFTMLIPFAVGLLFLFLCVKKIHQRPFSSIITSRQSFSWQRFWFAAGLWTLFLTVSLVIHCIAEPGNYIYQPNWKLFFPLLVIAVLLIPFQAGFEEVLFRGYLMQGLGLLAHNRWIPLLLTGFGFGLLHSFNPEVKAYGFWLTMPEYMGLGLFFGLLTLLDGGIELAIGIHVLNNIFLSLFISTESSALQTTALFRINQINTLSDILELYLFMLIFLFIANRKFQWSGWNLLLTKLSR